MKILHISAAVLVLLCSGCRPDKHPVNVGDIESLMQLQQENWNSGDITGFMGAYWQSDSLVFIGKRGLTYGWNATLRNYEKSYPNKQAMGRLQFENKKHEVMSDSAVYTIGKWTLFRSSDTLGGHFTLLWRKVNGHWKIVADHTS